MEGIKWPVLGKIELDWKTKVGWRYLSVCLDSPRRQNFKIPYLKKITYFLWGGLEGAEEHHPPKKKSPAARAQRRLRARNKAQGAALGAS